MISPQATLASTLLGIGLVGLLGGCSSLGLGPSDPLVPLAQAQAQQPSPGAASPSSTPEQSLTGVCWAMLQDLPIMDDSGLDPFRAEFFIGWGTYMRDVDRYLTQRLPMLEQMAERASLDEQAQVEESMEGILRMRAAVHGAAPRLRSAQDPVETGVVRVFTVASTDLLYGLEQACPSSGLLQEVDQDSVLSMT